VDEKWWVGDSSRGALVYFTGRSFELISCVNPSFDNYLAISFEDYAKLCKRYFPGCKDKSHNEILRILMNERDRIPVL